MNKRKTTKHRKQRKKERANRKARQLATQQSQSEPEQSATAPLIAEPLSPARRAFQDL